jgi:hypothetical protein
MEILVKSSRPESGVRALYFILQKKRQNREIPLLNRGKGLYNPEKTEIAASNKNGIFINKKNKHENGKKLPDSYPYANCVHGDPGTNSR